MTSSALLVFAVACASDFGPEPKNRAGRWERDTGLPDLDDTGGETAGDDTVDTGETGETGETGDTAETGDTEDTSPGTAEVCYPGPDLDDSACNPLVDWSASWGDGYDYPDPYEGSPQYAKPARFIDLATADPDMELAPDFVLGEFMQESKGQYALFQVHVVEYLQAIRELTGGPLNVNSGYRNVTYNESVGGAEYSRHMYGDAADMYSSVVSLDELGAICDDYGAGYVGYYSSWVHCDWRDDPLDPAFYDVEGFAVAARPERHSARLEVGADGWWSAPATGFEEGEPLRRWTAKDAAGRPIAVGYGSRWRPVPGAATVEVWIGGQVRLVGDLGEGG